MKKLSLILLILGLIFSQLFGITYNFSNGFEFHQFYYKLLPIASYAGDASPQLFLTTTWIGYIFYLIFGIINTSKVKSPSIYKPVLMMSGISIVVLIFEFSSILEDFNGTFNGKHFRIGWLIFLLGLWIFVKRYNVKPAKN